MKFKVLTNKAYLEATGWLEISRMLGAYKVICTPTTDMASNHYTVLAAFELPQ